MHTVIHTCKVIGYSSSNIERTNPSGYKDRAAGPDNSDGICSIVAGFYIGAPLLPLSFLVVARVRLPLVLVAIHTDYVTVGGFGTNATTVEGAWESWFPFRYYRR